MQLTCPHCDHVLVYSSEPPLFCSYCGQALSDTLSQSTAERDLEAATQVPTEVDVGGAGSLPESIGGYRIIRMLGTGGMGTVYEAEEKSTGRRVALKLLSPQFAPSKSAVERFRQEGRLASAIAHPRCVFVLAADEDAGRPYIVMELMPGNSLQDLVRDRGPLRPDEAITKILDVIEGLHEAHRLGVIHRDVKPSNCFLQADGRVKVGDFGLAKSLASATHLTKTGTFLGTVLFASPEQVRQDPLDEQTDVYSVAATLYYLLTGRAPFQSADAAATVARIAADPAPSMRSIRPDIPAALDKVVLRGLERERARRWRNLEVFRQAILAFVPKQLSVGGMGIRFGAFLLDYLVVSLPIDLITSFWGDDLDPAHDVRFGPNLLEATLWILYFVLSEALWACSIGKWLLGLRVRAANGKRASMGRIVLRTVTFFALFNLVSFVMAAMLFNMTPEDVSRNTLLTDVLPLVKLADPALFIVLTIAPMRARNGFRGLHEFISGTRVIRLPWPEWRRTVWGKSTSLTLMPIQGLPERLGPYHLRGVAYCTSDEKVLVADDEILKRQVWIWMRPVDCPVLGAVRRETNRATRPRWLSCGNYEEMQWDAFAARAGYLLPDMIVKEGKLEWGDDRYLLEELTEELVESEKDGTLPGRLGVSQVWVQPNGGIQLLDFALDRPETAQGKSSAQQPSSCWAAATGVDSPDQTLSAVPEVLPIEDEMHRRPLPFLGQVAVLTLEGRERQLQTGPKNTVRAPLPGYAARLLGRLLTNADGYHQIKEFQTALLAARAEPSQVDRRRRLAHLLTFLSVGLFWMLFVVFSAESSSWDLAKQHAQTSAELTVESTSNFLCCAFNSSAWVRVGGTVQLDADMRLEQQLQHNGLTEQPPRGSFTWYLQRAQSLIRKEVTQKRVLFEESSPRERAQALRMFNDGDDVVTERVVWFIVLLCWPFVCVIWATLFPQGVGYLIMGFSLVRADGRRAGHLQCAWRAFLVWAPVTTLLALSFWFNVSYWAASDPIDKSWMIWLSSSLAFSTVLVLVGYIGLALWRPSRDLHDYLAGTYLVPK
jgi:hypothetical protein